MIHEDFSLSGKIPVQYKIVDDSNPVTQMQINNNFKKQVFQFYLKMAQHKRLHYYRWTDKWLYEALQHYSIQNKDVLLFGSANPWYEAITVNNKVKRCTVIQYSDRPSFDDRIIYVKPGHKLQQFDIGISISSFQHDGLGRYGDPLNPFGDMLAMKNAKQLIKKDGLLFLSVPIGADKLCYNVHRIYGNVRFPMLIQGWQVLSRYGCFEGCFQSTLNSCNKTTYQPLFILKNL